jgi:nitrous oxide reductase accessory protein NosL
VVLGLLWGTAGWAEEAQVAGPGEKDKCPVCGMFVAKYPDFIAKVVFLDGTYAFFDGCKDMFKYIFQLQKYAPGKKVSDIGAVYVTDYYELKLIDGRKALYVVGSDVLGPMGRELIPFLTEADAREFMVDHVGKVLLRFEEVTERIVMELD